MNLDPEDLRGLTVDQLPALVTHLNDTGKPGAAAFVQKFCDRSEPPSAGELATIRSLVALVGGRQPIGEE